MSGIGNALNSAANWGQAKVQNLFAPPQPTLPLPYDQQMLEAKRQQALAEALMEQGAGEIPIQSYKGTQAPIPWTAVLAKALTSGLGGYRGFQAKEMEKTANAADEADAQKRIDLLTKGRPTALPQELQDPEGPQVQSTSYQKLSPEEVMAEVLRGGGPKARDAMAIAAPRLFAQQDKAEARAQEVKDKTRRQLSPAEVAQRGYRPGTVVTVDGFNNEQVEQAPDTLTPEAEKQRIRIAAASREPREVTWGQPVTEIGENGKPQVVRYSNAGGRMVVPGAIPKDAERAPPIHVQDTALKTGASLQQQDSLISNYKDEFSGHYFTGDWNNFFKSHIPGGDPTGQADWWANYAKYVNAVRNDQFGASLTPGEKAEFEKTVATPGMSAAETRKRLEAAQAIVTSAAARQTRMYGAIGYNKEALEGAYGFSLDELDQRDKAMQKKLAERNKPQTAAGALPKSAAAQGISQAEWNAMLPEDRKLWK